MAAEGEGQAPGRPREASSNPYKVKIECPACGRKTAANTRTGALYSHTEPGSTKVCPASTTIVIEPTDADTRPVLAPPIKRAPSKPAPPAVPNDDGPSVNVRALPGGLPGLGRRR